LSSFTELPSKIEKAVNKAEQVLSIQMEYLEKISEKNHIKVLNAFQKFKVSAYHFQGSTGYGLGDVGRDTLDNIIADIMGTEAAIIRHQFVSGTHAIASALFGILRPGDHFISVTGMPYDTLQHVIGLKGDKEGTLADYGIEFEAIPLDEKNNIQYDLLASKITAKTKLITIQRSNGYEWRYSFGIDKIEELVKYIKANYPHIYVFVDNCYGELVEDKEPGNVGVDLMAGSLIKNLGGTLAPTGGYIAGKKHLVDLAANRFTAPGVGSEVGASLDLLRLLYQGVFISPLTVGEAIKGAVFSAAFWKELGFEVLPEPEEKRTDIIQSIKLGTKDGMIAFCQGIQKGSPVDSYVLPIPSEMPGYSDEVIMAGGTFIQGATSEFSGDGPLREPFIVYMQGAISYTYVKYANILAALNLLEKNLI